MKTSSSLPSSQASGRVAADSGHEKAKHTPTPWFNDGVYVCAAGDDIYGSSVATAIDDGLTCNSVKIANAEFIVTACNSHEELLDALKAVLSEAEFLIRFAPGGDKGDKSDAMLRAHAAIAKAEGKTS
jgi:hypothetical protein